MSPDLYQDFTQYLVPFHSKHCKYGDYKFVILAPEISHSYVNCISAYVVLTSPTLKCLSKHTPLIRRVHNLKKLYAKFYLYSRTIKCRAINTIIFSNSNNNIYLLNLNAQISCFPWSYTSFITRIFKTMKWKKV